LSLPVEAFDPFDGVRMGRELRSHPPDAPGRFAPLLGLLLDEAAQTPHSIDFLHPRKKEAPSGRRRTLVLAAVAAATLLLVVIGCVWLLFANLGAEKRRLGNQLRQLERDAKTAAKSIARLEEIERWTRGEVVWLDELHNLSVRMPSAEEAIVEYLQASSRSEGGGQIVLDGLVSELDVIERIEQEVRDSAHRVVGAGSHQDNSYPDYDWRYHETVIIQRTDDLRRDSGTAKPKTHRQTGGGDTAVGTSRDSPAQSDAARRGGAP
jgi:hypothetical protein